MPTDDGTTRLLKAGAATAATLIIGWLVAPSLSRWYSRNLADQLAQRVEVADDSQVKAPLRQLASLGTPAIEPLVVAAASQRTAIASVARQIIDERLAVWEFHATANAAETANAEVAVAAAAISTALAAHIDEFGPAGKQWVERLTLKMIELADRLPASQTSVLLENCSRVLAAVPPRSPRLRTLTDNTALLDKPSPKRFTAPEPQLDALTRASEGSLEILARVGTTPAAPVPSGLTHLPSLSSEAQLKVPAPTASKLNWSPGGRGSQDNRVATLPQTETETLQQHVIETTPSVENQQVIDVPTPQAMAMRAATLRQLSNDELFLRLPESKFYEAAAIRAVLVKRGFTDGELELRQQLTTSAATDRLRLMDDVSQLSAAAAGRMLRWLLNDENAEVRLRALTALATTDVPDLVDLARELAVHDDDSRVAEFASRLLRKTR